MLGTWYTPGASQIMEFLTTYELSEFKELKGAGPRIEVVRNPKTDKLFFSCGSLTGAVSSNGYREYPVISHVAADGAEFFILHNKGKSANVVDSFDI